MQDVIGFAGYPRSGQDNIPFFSNYKDYVEQYQNRQARLPAAGRGRARCSPRKKGGGRRPVILFLGNVYEQTLSRKVLVKLSVWRSQIEVFTI